ncbi:hypothetical protein F4810DRAFT_212595 [Camillea tinctor]|nr:hypothetical protein F4810DRAFT_212595 [Camillea tinctor]
MYFHAALALMAALASSQQSLTLALKPGESLYDLARRDCPVGRPGIPQYLRCITECRVSSEVEEEQKNCVEKQCSHICKESGEDKKEERDL